ncbi:MAG TPA: GNAT family N-acetyltransferase [Actinoplanes sp.]|jgi:CelD/BcsL family acetyltransferase involved in cellulose biosynthesis
MAIDEWSAETRIDDDALKAVEREWNDLHGRCASATPFQSGAWVRSWWSAYGRAGGLRLVLVRRNGQLVAGAALMARRHRFSTVLTPMGAGLSDFEDVLVDDRFAAEATRRLIGALLECRRWDRLQFDECRPGGAARRLYDAWPGARWRGAGSTCLEIAVAPVQQTLATLPRDTAKSFRKKLRRIDAAGFEITEAPATEAAAAVRDLLDLHRRQWEGRPGVNPEHVSPRFEQFLGGAIGDLVGTGQAVVLQYRRGGRVVASELLIVAPDLVGAYLFGFDPELREEISVIVMLDSQALVLADRLGRRTLSLLRGVEPYKLRWRPRPVPNERLVLVRPGSLAGAVHPPYLRARVTALAAAERRFPRVLAMARAAREADWTRVRSLAERRPAHPETSTPGDDAPRARRQPEETAGQ